MLWGVVFMDPGTTTGLELGVLDIRKGDSTEETFKRTKSRTEVLEVDCTDIYEGCGTIGMKIGMLEKKEWDRLKIPEARRVLVYEDFVLRPHAPSRDRTLLDPVRVTECLRGLIGHKEITWVRQQPSDAKNRWTNERLKKAGLWIVGSEHKRDARRHGALFLVGLQQKGRNL